MGYYTGSGVTTQTSQSCQVKERILWYGVHDIVQERTSTTVVKNGVELPASTSGSSFNMSDQTWYLSSSSSTNFFSPSCKGTNVSVSYSRIGDSNLYALTTTTEVCRVMATGLQTDWVPTGWQG